jgi:hypothetical protein
MEQELLYPVHKEFMNTHLFESFSKMIDKLPPGSVLTATERECQMLENDLVTNRPVSKQEVHSILSFCRFLAAAKSKRLVAPTVLPPGHTAFYRRTLARMIEAGEMPESAEEQFDGSFMAPLLKSVAEVS